MKLYHVDHFEYELSNSLLPPRDPLPDEETEVEAGLVSPSGVDLVTLFMKIGYTPYQAEHLYRALFNHYWYDYGFHAVHKCNTMIYYWQQSYLAPAWEQAKEKPPVIVTPAMIYYAVVVGAILVTILLVAPEFEETFRWYPPCDLYLGTYNEQLWWMALVGVGLNQRPVYAATGYEGNVITAHTYEYLVPPVVTDVIHFWGTMDFRCWKIPWYRSYRLQFAHCTYIGMLTKVGANLYDLKLPHVDLFAPVGPMTVPIEAWCRAYSPCHV